MATGKINRRKLKTSDKMEVIDHCLLVNGRPFDVEYPDEPIYMIQDGKLVTLVVKACGCNLYYWDPEEIVGDFT